MALIVFVSILVGLLSFYERYSFAYEQEKLSDHVSKSIEIFNDQLNAQKRYALSLSLMMSQNYILRQALKNNNQQQALVEIDKILLQIEDSVGIKNIDIQMHTKDLRAFARNWDKSDYFGTPLESFRKGLVRVKNTQSSFASIELGKRLNIKAISPIFDKRDNFIGSIEVIMDFSNVKQRLKKLNIEMLALLEKRYIDIAVDLKNHKKIDDFYIVENRYSNELYQLLYTKQNLIKHEKLFYELDSRVLTFIPMKSVGIEDVGIIALFIGKKPIDNYNLSIDEVSFENQEYSFDMQYKREVSIK